MSRVTIYQFSLYDVANDEMRKSRRWATREAIERVGGEVIEQTSTEVDGSVVDTAIPGMTIRDFNPHAIVGFQTRVRASS